MQRDPDPGCAGPQGPGRPPRRRRRARRAAPAGRRLPVPLLALLAAVALTASGCGEGSRAASDTSSPTTTTPADATVRPSTTAPRAPSTTTPPAPTPAPTPPSPAAVVARSGGPLPADALAALLAVPTDGTAVVGGGQVLLDRGDGWGVPLEAVAVDPAALGPLLPPAPATALGALAPGTALLGETSARRRDLAPGDPLPLGGRELTVAGTVSDAAVGSAEVVVHAADAPGLGLDAARYVVLGTTGDVAALERSVAAALAGRPRVLAATLGPWPWAPSWREVLPAAVLKERFGEFALRPTGGRSVALEPGWAEANIGTGTVPLLGQVRCHRAVLEPLAAALGELEQAGLGSLLRPGDYGGCFSPRLIGPGAAVSRHAWGLAVDVNVSTNPFGSPPTQDPRLVEIMEHHGFTFGGRWPVPDGMHFEYRGAPLRS